MAIGLGAGLWAASFMSLRGYQHRPPFAEEHNLAVHLALGHGFLSPFDLSATAPPSAYNAPLYPMIIAAAYRIFGIRDPEAVSFLMLLNALCFGASAAAIHELARLLFRARSPALLASLVFALHPMFLFYAGDFWDGMLSLTLLLWVTVGAFWIGAAAERDQRTPPVSAVALGASMGLLALTNTVHVMTCPVLLALAFPRRLRARRWGLACIALAVCLMVLAPWTIRNVRAFGRLLFVRTGFGLALWLGNEPVGKGWLDAATYRLHPAANTAERRSLLTLGEPAYNDFCAERFRRRLAEDPLGFGRRCLRRIGYLLIDEPTEPAPFPFLANYRWRGIILDKVLLNATLAALGLAGILAAQRLRYRPGLIAGLMLCTALPFIPTAVIDRYALPLRALLLLFAASFVWMIGVRIRSGQWPTPPPAVTSPAGSSMRLPI